MNGTGESPEFVDSIEQAAELDTYTVIPISHLAAASIVVNSNISNASVKVSYLGDKTTLTGHTVMAPSLITTLAMDPFETKTHSVNFMHAALTGGYGAVLLQNTGGFSSNWQAWLMAGPALYSGSGAALAEGTYRVPYTAGSTNVVLAVTNLGSALSNVYFVNLAPTFEDEVVGIYGMSTFKFDAAALGWTMNSTGGAVDIHVSGSTIAVGGYFLKGGVKYRTQPIGL